MKKLVLLAALGFVGAAQCMQPKPTVKRYVFDELLDSKKTDMDAFVATIPNEAQQGTADEQAKEGKMFKSLAKIATPTLLPKMAKYFTAVKKVAFPNKKVKKVKPDQEQDEKNLTSLVKMAVKDADLVPFVKIASKNFKKEYKSDFDFRGVELSKGKTFGSWIDSRKNKKSALAKQVTKIQPEDKPKSSGLWKGIVAAGVVAAGAYMLYKYNTATNDKANSRVA